MRSDQPTDHTIFRWSEDSTVRRRGHDVRAHPRLAQAESPRLPAGWRDRAACRRADPELFFPVGTGRPAMQQAEQAIAVCHQCPVIDDCLGFALTTGQEFGIWGGMMEERRRLVRHRAASGRPASARGPATR